jgi:hypothetical protein
MSKKLSLSLSQLCAPSSSKLVGRDISTAMNKRRLKTKMRNKRERERERGNLVSRKEENKK